MKKGSVVLISAIVALSLGVLSFVVALFVLAYDVASTITTILFVAGSLLSVLGLILTILRFIKYGFTPVAEPVIKVKEVKTVDVKPVKETKEEQLFKEYEKLFNEGLISKEDLEKKRNDLL